MSKKLTTLAEYKKMIKLYKEDEAKGRTNPCDIADDIDNGTETENYKKFEAFQDNAVFSDIIMETLKKYRGATSKQSLVTYQFSLLLNKQTKELETEEEIIHYIKTDYDIFYRQPEPDDNFSIDY